MTDQLQKISGSLDTQYHKAEKYVTSKWVYLVHILIVAPLLIVGGFYRNKVPRNFWKIFFVLSAVVFSYHFCKTINKTEGECESQRTFKKVINIIHAFVIAPLLFYIAKNEGRIDSKIWTGIIVVGGVALFYHGAKLIKNDLLSLC